MREFEELQERLFALYAEQRFEEMHELVQGAVDRFPGHRSRITYWEACIDSLLGNPNQALERLRRGAENGLFWPENSLHTDPDLAPAPDTVEVCSRSRKDGIMRPSPGDTRNRAAAGRRELGAYLHLGHLRGHWLSLPPG